MTETHGVIGEAVLKDYPLRLWAEQQERIQELLREFTYVVASSRDNDGSSAPKQLVELAEMFQTRFGLLLAHIQEDRETALAAGRDRMDSRVPLVEGTPQLLAEVSRVMSVVDDYCRQGQLLALARSPEQIALMEWSINELITQFEGGEPTPWRGPF